MFNNWNCYRFEVIPSTIELLQRIVIMAIIAHHMLMRIQDLQSVNLYQIMFTDKLIHVFLLQFIFEILIWYRGPTKHKRYQSKWHSTNPRLL